MEQLPVRVRPGRFSSGAVLALVLTIGLALFAAVAGPYTPGGRGGAATSSRPAVGGARRVPLVATMPAPAPTPPEPDAAASLPRLVRFGAPVPSGKLLVSAGGYAFLDMDAGRVDAIPGATWPSQVVRTRAGLACVCVNVTSRSDGQSAAIRITWLESGVRPEDLAIGTIPGYLDPGRGSDDQGESVAVSATASPAGDAVYIGTAVRERRAWLLAVTAVDLTTRRVSQPIVVERVPLTERVENPTVAPSPRSPIEAPTMATATAPVVRVSPDGGSAVIGAWIGSHGQELGHRHWIAEVRRGLLRDIEPFRDQEGWLASSDCQDEGFASANVYYALCYTWTSSPRLSWIPLHGRGRQITLEGIGSSSSVSVGGVLDAARGRYYVWSPDTLGIARIDLIGGRMEQIGRLRPTTSVVGGDPLRAVAHGLAAWIAPVAAAKTWLNPALAISPDGSRLYALGVAPQEGRMSGSSGVWVIETATLKEVDQWDATADFVSVVATADGRFVLASGMPRVDAQGRETNWPASLTAYDSRSGEVKLIAGDLGSEPVTFAGEGLR
jgi:hypothetical protein